MADLTGTLGSLANLYGQYQSYNNANNTANTNSAISGAATNAWQNQVQALQNQIYGSQATSSNAYNTAAGNAATSNAGLQGNISNLTSSLNSLSDPNSAYMQNARQAIERKDAAAGRRSQWGDREVQLAGTLADYVGKYAPGMQNAITAANNQISTNNQGLASLYNNYATSSDRNNQTLSSLINGAGALQGTANTAAANNNNANNQLGGLITTGLGGLSKLYDQYFNGANTTQDQAGLDAMMNSLSTSSSGASDLGSYFEE